MADDPRRESLRPGAAAPPRYTNAVHHDTFESHDATARGAELAARRPDRPLVHGAAVKVPVAGGDDA